MVDKKNKTLIILVLVLATMVAISFSYGTIKRSLGEKRAFNQNIGELIARASFDLPLEQDVEFLVNEIIKVGNDWEIQSINFYSKKDVNENFDLYKKLLTDNGWNVTEEQKTENSALLMGSDDRTGGNFKFSVSRNDKTGYILVELKLTVQE